MASTSIASHTTVYLPNVLLDESNYPTWLFRMEAFLNGQNCYGFVDGSCPCPPQYVTSSDGSIPTLSADYVAWKTQDQSIVNMLGQTLSPVAMSCVVGSRSAQEMWARLKQKFAAPNRQNILQLKTNLQSLKKGSDNIETYLDKIKASRDALETVGVFLDDEDIVVTVLRGLPSEFAAIKTVIRAQFVSCTMGELQTLLKAAEVDIENEMGSSSALPLTAMVAAQSSSPTTHTLQTSTSTATTPTTSSSTPAAPPGFSPLPQSSSFPYTPIPAIPYGSTSYPGFDQSSAMTGFFAGRGNNRFNNPGPAMGRFNSFGHNFGPRNNNTAHNFGNGGPFNRTNTGAPNQLMTCQLCGRVGHGAKTCRTLNNYPFAQGNNNDVCQYCGKNNHTADRCFYIIGFPNQQHNQAQNPGPATGNAMLAAATNPPQYWLADTGATNHMTNEIQMLNNIAPYPTTDTVQVGNGQGVGQNLVPRTE